MMPILSKIFSRLAATTGLVVTVFTLLSGRVSAAEVELQQQVLNGLHYPTSSQQFFERGRRTLEQEIQLILQRLRSSPETILYIRDDLPEPMSEEWLRQEKLWLQEHPQIMPQDTI